MENDIDIISHLGVFLLCIAIGMMIGLLIREPDLYHGTNADSHSLKRFYHRKNKKCYQFKPKIEMCPNDKTRFETMVSTLLQKTK